MKLTVLFTVVVCSILLEKVDSSSQSNIQNFLQALQQQLAREQRQINKKHNKLYYNNDKDDSYYGSLNKREVDRIFSISSQAEKKQRKSYKQKQQDQKYILRLPGYQGLQLVSEDSVGQNGNRDSASSSESNNRDDDDNQNEYSKVYVILNSEAIRKSKNKNKLNALLSSLLNAPSQLTHSRYQDQVDQYQQDRYWDDQDRYQEEDDRHQDRRQYKGFLLNDDNFEDSFRRKMPRGSGEGDDPRPKQLPSRQREPRERPRRGRERGGGSGGHTAIPYIRQHGDIYEKDE